MISKHLVKTILQVCCIILMLNGVFVHYDFTLIGIGIGAFIGIELLYRHDRQILNNKEKYT